MNVKPVVVYGATGYTGTLTCEDLARRGVPFVVAGRSQQKLDLLVADLRAFNANVEAIQVEHSVTALEQLLRDRKVIINCTGPYVKLGETVVQAALHAGCHYVDITGEQPFMLDMRERYGARFAEQKLVLNPSASYFWGPGCALTEICLQTPGIDSVTVFYSQENLQTVASAQSTTRMLRAEGMNLHDGVQKTIVPGVVKKVLSPDSLEVVNALSIATGEPTFQLDNPRMRNHETLIAFKVPERALGALKTYVRFTRSLPKAFDNFTDRMIEKYKKDPPREVPETARFVCAAWGVGNNVSVSAVMRGVGPYLLTGWMAAEAAERLVAGDIKRFGYVSTAQFVGPRELLAAMEKYGAHTVIDTHATGERALPQMSVLASA